jgi:hypothetical protein
MANYTKYGFNAVVAKPYGVEEMQRVINRLLSKKKK